MNARHQQWRLIAWSILAGLFELGALASLPAALGSDGNRLEPSALMQFLALAVFRILLGAWVSQKQSALQRQLESDAKVKAVEGIQAAPLDRRQSLNFGRQLALLDDDPEALASLATARIQFFSAAILLVGYALLAVRLAPLWAAVSIGFGLFHWLMARGLNRRLYFWAEVTRLKKERYQQLLTDRILGAGKNAEKSQDSLWQKNSWLQALGQRDRWRLRMGPASELIGVAVFGVALIFLLRLRIQAGSLLAFLAVFQRIHSRLSILISAKSQIEDLKPQEAAFYSSLAFLKATRRPETSPDGGWHVNEVSFRWPKQIVGLNRLSAHIYPAEWIRVVGPNGSGKTTLVRLIASFLLPQEGTVSHPTRTTLRYVGTDDHLVMGPSQTWKRASPAERQKIKYLLNLNEADLQTLFEIDVGFRAHRLSTGMRQKRRIAEALSAQPSLLILDEATNALDEESESVFFGRLRETWPQLAVLVTSHRPLPQVSFDAIWTLRDGRLERDATSSPKPITHRIATYGACLCLFLCGLTSPIAWSQSNKSPSTDVGIFYAPLFPMNITGFHEIITTGGLRIAKGIGAFRPELTLVSGRGSGAEIDQGLISWRNPFEIEDLDLFKFVWLIGLQMTYYRRPSQGTTEFPYYNAGGFHFGFGLLFPIARDVSFRNDFIYMNGPGRILLVTFGFQWTFGEPGKQGEPAAATGT